MAHSIGINAGCLLVGDFAEENVLPTTLVPVSVGQSQETVMVGSFVDSWPGDIRTKQFKVLLRDNRIITVRGHSLQYLQNPSNPSDLGSYAILARAGAEEVTVAIFRVSEVTGVFTGGLEAARTSA